MKYQWIHLVDFELLPSDKSPIAINEAGGCAKLALLAEEIHHAINVAEKRVRDDGYIINFISSAERFDAEHYDAEIHEAEFLTIGDLIPVKNEVDYVSIIVYD